MSQPINGLTPSCAGHMLPETRNILERLLQGNHRFALGQPLRADISVARRYQIANSQQPWAMILGCSDSRVPPEIVFDCGLGDLFVIRTAGHTVDRSVIETIQFGIQSLHIPLVMVLGHARCGAVSAALQEQQGWGENCTSWIAEQIAPAKEQCKNEHDVLSCVIRAHVKKTVARLEHLIGSFAQGVDVLGAYYDLDTGIVEIMGT
ncbi:MAG: carbonic anhydrase [Anaerolineae bacterium]|nr:carbonic anhydrase [Anaerolineae bacterium]